LTAIAFILIVPLNFSHYYDFPELLFLLLVSWIALRANWLWLLPVAALATWNKESFLLFVPAVYPLLRVRAGRNTASLATALIAVISIAVNLAVRIKYQHNPGSAMEFHLWANLQAFLDLLTLSPTPLFRVYGGIAPHPFHLFGIALLIWMIRRAWGSLPNHIKLHIVIAALINIPFFIVFGQSRELRGLSLLYVSLLAVIAVNFSDWVCASQSERIAS